MYTLQDWEDAVTTTEILDVAESVLSHDEFTRMVNLASAKVIKGMADRDDPKDTIQAIKAIFNDAVVAKLRGEAKS